MITKEVIKTLYHKYRKLPKSPDCLDIAQLFDGVAATHNITIDIDNDEMVIGSIKPDALFHRISLRRIHAIVPFEEWVAIVLHSSIIFLNRKSPEIDLHIKPEKESLLDRLRSLFAS